MAQIINTKSDWVLAMQSGQKIKSKEECLAFMDYLLKKEDPIIDHVKYFGGLSRGMVDIAKTTESLLMRIKGCSSKEEVYDKIGKLERFVYCSKELDKRFSFIKYEEELTEYLISLGISSEKAKELTVFIRTGRYKAECRMHKKSWGLEQYGEIHEWAKTVHFLASWDKLPKYFISEYKIFSGENIDIKEGNK